MPPPRPSNLIPTELPSFLTEKEAGLLTAAAQGDSEAVQELLGQVEADKPRDGEGFTALHRAAINGHVDVVRLLLAAKAGPSRKDNRGRTPLHWAAGRGHLEIVQGFINSGISTELLDRKRRTPLRVAADGGHVKVVTYLVQQGAAVDAQDEDKSTPLIRAAVDGREAVVRLLLKHGAEVEHRNSDGFTALHAAAVEGHDAVLDALLEGQANIDGIDATGKTALIWAAEEGFVTTVKLLLSRGANVMATNSHKDTALHGAASRGKNAVAEILLQNGADIEARNKIGRTALAWAAAMGRQGVIQFLLDRGAAVNPTGNSGRTPLHHAAKMGEGEAVAALLRGGADLEARDNRGWTALHLAAAKGRVSTIELLLDNHANVNAIDTKGKTPTAVASGKRAVALLTARAGLAEPNHRDAASEVEERSLGDQGRNIQVECANPTLVLAGRGPGTHHSVLKARQWIQKAKDHIKTPKQKSNKAHSRIKVAVIDTGVDLANHDISLYDRRIHFLRGNAEDNMDYDGHGTMVALLLLSLTPNIDVYVYKVADGRGNLSLSLDQIKELAQLIKEAAHKPDLDLSHGGEHQDGEVSRKSVGIDILNLSFGFADADEPNLEPLGSALQYIHTISKVLILAAACNDGGNAGVMWPASEASCAICVNSSDGDGNPSFFNPTQSSPKFCTLGEGLELRLPKGQMEKAKTKTNDPSEVAHNKTESGTSFATPVAAAIVAMVLQFADNNAETVDLTDKERHRLRKLRTHPGMIRVFKEKCVEKSLATRGDFYYLAPWFFSLKSTNIYGLLDTLERA